MPVASRIAARLPAAPRCFISLFEMHIYRWVVGGAEAVLEFQFSILRCPYTALAVPAGAITRFQFSI